MIGNLFGSMAGARQVAKRASASAASCLKENKASPEGQIIYTRLWANDDTDTADKLSDPKPLTKDQQNALVKLHSRVQVCRQISSPASVT